MLTVFVVRRDLSQVPADTFHWAPVRRFRRVFAAYVLNFRPVVDLFRFCSNRPRSRPANLSRHCPEVAWLQDRKTLELWVILPTILSRSFPSMWAEAAFAPLNFFFPLAHDPPSLLALTLRPFVLHPMARLLSFNRPPLAGYVY